MSSSCTLTAKLTVPLTGLQRAVTREAVWVAALELVKTALPLDDVIFVLVDDPTAPVYLRSTAAVRDWERFAGLSLSREGSSLREGALVETIDRDLGSNCRWRRVWVEEILEPMGWHFGMYLRFRSGAGRAAQGGLMGLREASRGKFTLAEMEIATHLQPMLEAAVRRAGEQERQEATQFALQHLVRTLPWPVAVVGAEGDVVFSNRAGREAMAAWSHGGIAFLRTLKPGGDLPQDLQATCRALASEWRDRKGGSARSSARKVTLNHQSDPSFRAEVELVEAPPGGGAQSSFVIIFSIPAPRHAECQKALAALPRLTSAELGVVRLAAAGEANGEIAVKLGVSLSTVRTHLRNVFKKLGISCRSRLAPLSEVLGKSSPGVGTGKAATGDGESAQP